MGFDLYGVKAKNKKGEYFRNNVWWWRPLQYFLILSCGDFLTDKDVEGLSFNNGYTIGIRKTQKMIARLEEYLDNTDRFSTLLRRIKRELPDDYPTKTSEFKQNLEEFIVFLKNSGGFEIY